MKKTLEYAGLTALATGMSIALYAQNNFESTVREAKSLSDVVSDAPNSTYHQSKITQHNPFDYTTLNAQTQKALVWSACFSIAGVGLMLCSKPQYENDDK